MESFKFNIGDKVSCKKIFTPEEVLNYSLTCGDNNPLHTNPEYAANTRFGRPIVQGLLVASLFGGLLGSHLPGNGTIHLGQNVKFLKPVYVGEEITAEIEIIHLRHDKPIITFLCKAIKSDDSIAVEGEAVVIYKGKYFI